jgi:hypothetical protein
MDTLLPLTPAEIEFLQQLFQSQVAVTLQTVEIVGPLKVKIMALRAAPPPNTEGGAS